MPVEAAVAWNVLVGIPERAVVARVNGNAGVVAPPAQSASLRPDAREHDVDGFHSAAGVGRHSTRVGDFRMDAAAGLTEPHSNVTDLVHADAAHPECGAAARDGALLKDNWCPVGVANFVPARPGCGAAGSNGVCGYESLVSPCASESPVREAKHQPVAKGVEPLARSRLRNAGSATTGQREGRYG